MFLNKHIAHQSAWRFLHVIAAICIFVLISQNLYAQELDFPASPSPVGSGARAAGMADAFVAIADDATAASWNPAGLVQLERPEISIVGSYNGIFESFDADFHDEVHSKHNDSNIDLNYLSVVYPLPFVVLGRNVVVSLNYQRKYDFSRKFKVDFNNASATPLGTVIPRMRTMDFRQKGGLSTITPAFAFELTHRLSVGLAVNFWRKSFLSDNGWEQTIRVDEVGFFGSLVYSAPTYVHEEYENFEGENFTVGLLWSATEKWNLAARYDSAFTGKTDYKRVGYNIDVWPNLGILNLTANDNRMMNYISKETRHIRFPSSFALGTAYRFNDKLTLSFDVTRTDWNDYWVKDGDGRRSSLVDVSSRDNPFTKVDFDPTYTVRFGAEYVFIPKKPDEKLNNLWTLRGGLFYDEEPATGKSNKNSWLWENATLGRPSGKPDKFYGFALGCGLLAYQRVNIDLAYQLRYGHDVNSDFLRGVPGFSEDVYQHRFLVSTVIYF